MKITHITTKLILSIQLIFISYISLTACIENDVILRSQDAVNEFASQLINCDLIQGDLIIGPSSSIVDLSPLENLKEIQGDLKIEDVPQLENLLGLNNLIFVGGNMSFFKCEDIDILALNNLETILGDLRFNATNIRNFDGFNSLTILGGSLDFIDNSRLISLSGFPNLKFIGDDLNFKFESNFSVFENSFTNLDSIGGRLTFEETKLESISGLPKLSKIGELVLHQNDSLINLDGLTNLVEIHGLLFITFNSNIVSINGLDNINEELLIDGGLNSDFILTGNRKLAFCNEGLVCRILRDSRINKSFSNNGPGCSDRADIFFNQCRIHVCPTNELKLTSQEEIDNFPVDHPLCTFIEGNLIIGGPEGMQNSDITNLDGLSNLDTITGDITISNNPELISLSGLDEIRSFFGGLKITNNDKLEEINTLHDILGINGDLEISNNEKLITHLSPIEIQVITENLIIKNNPSMRGVFQFEDLSSIGGDFIVDNNQSLTGIAEMPNLKSIGGDLICTSNESILRPYEFNLDFLGGEWIIDNNASLVETPFIGLDTVFNSILISNNSKLEVFDNSRIEVINGDLIIEDNPFFEEIELDSLKNIGGDLVLKGTALTGVFDLFTFFLFDNLNGDLIIEDNLLLNSIANFKCLLPEKVNQVSIRNNPSLNVCDIAIVCDKFQNDINTLIIEGNTGDCENLNTQKTRCDKGVCLGGNRLFRNQKEIDDFVKSAQVCSVIEGNLEVRSSLAGEPFNLEQFDFIEIVEGDFELHGTNVTIGSGLVNLNRIEGDFLFSVNNLPDLPPMPQLELVQGQLRFFGTDLTSLEGMETLKEVGTLQLFSSSSVKSFRGMESLKIVNDDLIITANTSSDLQSLEGLENIEYVGNTIQVRGGTNLTDVFAINHIDPRDLTSLNFSGNSLSECSLKLVCEFIQLNPDFTTIFTETNGEGCREISDIECEDYGVSGCVYYDINENGLKDDGEFGIPNIPLSNITENHILRTNDKGRYFLYLEDGDDFEINLLENELEWSLTSPSDIAGTFDLTTPVIQDFGLAPKFDRHQSTVSLTSSNTRCNESGKYFLRFQNTGTHIENGEIQLNYDSKLKFVNSTRSPKEIDEGNATLVWSYQNLRPFESFEFEIQFENPNQSFAGELLESELIQYYFNGEQSLVLGSKLLEEQIRCAYDPNDKQISPIGIEEEAFILRDEEVTYTIRFQNTGNDYARNVRLIDTLSENFNLETFEFLDASHNVQIELNSNILSFYFDDIYLIDSLTSFEESQGYTTFKIKFKEDTPDFSVIENYADIFFDFNPPIRTNSVINTVVDKFGTITNTSNVSKSEFKIFPNPTKDLFNIQLANVKFIAVYDISNKILFDIKIDPNSLTTEVDLSGFPSGIYFMKAIDINGDLHWGKVVKQ